MQSSNTIYTKRERIAQMARNATDMAFTSLNHYLDMEWLKEAYRLTRKDGATGVDGMSGREYGENLEDNLQNLLNRAKSGTYRAPPVRRVHIPKGKGTETRPIGIPTFEDKVLQRAVVMILECIYEEDFYSFSYGFRPGRSAHQALAETRSRTMRGVGTWVIELDIRKYFDNVSHAHLKALLNHRVRDGVLLRLIGKWLKAGVMEGSQLSYPNSGTPQGGVSSPLLANIYLHEVLDKWFEEEVRPRLYGHGSVIRYADDGLLIFDSERDARRVLEVLPKRFARFGLTLHPDKTRLLHFAPKPKSKTRLSRNFDFLGFTHYWGISRKGNWVVKRRTAKDRFARALKGIREYCRRYRHEPVWKQHKALSLKLKGHYSYYGISGNSGSLGKFRNEAENNWFEWLKRRGQKRPLTWDRFVAILKRYPLPPPRVVHSYLRRK